MAKKIFNIFRNERPIEEVKMPYTQNSLNRIICKLLQVLFGNNSKDRYSKDFVKAAIQHTVESTDPWLRALSGYKRKLRPAVVRAMSYVESLVDEMPPAIVIDSNCHITDPRLRQFFTSTSDMWKVLRNCITSSLRGDQEWSAPWFYALLTMQKQERAVLGAEVVGDIVLRDLLHHTVSFDCHQLMDLSDSEDETRRKLKKRAYDHLLSLALGQITIANFEKDKLQQCRALMQSKLNLLQRTGRGFQQAAAAGQADIDEIKELVGDIDAKLLELGGDDRMLEAHLDIVAGVLGRPAEHLWVRKETLIIDRMGIRRNEPADGAQEVSLDIVCDSDEINLVCMPVAIRKDAFQSGCSALDHKNGTAIARHSS